MSRTPIVPKQGDIVLIRFPFTNFSGDKKRPALVISSDRYNERGSDTIVLSITSKIPDRPRRDDYELSENDQNFAGLNRRSIVKLGKIATVNQNIILKRIGRLPEKTVKDIIHKLSDEVLTIG